MALPIRWLTEKLAVAGQISPSDLSEIASSGFQSVICNRPDFEYGADQPTAESIQSAAEQAGLQFRFLPVAPDGGTAAPDGGTAANAQEMGVLLSEMPRPILAYCYSGGRCMALIGLAARMGHAIPE